jgi:hypothetical protein
MSYEFYKTVHVLGIALVLLALGGIAMHTINGGTKASNSFRKTAMITHGVGLLLVLVAGFGMLAKLQIHGIPTWAALKLVIWVVLGAFAALAYKEGMAKKVWLSLPVLVVAATVLAQLKP